MPPRVVLDRAAFDVIDTPAGAQLRHLLRQIVFRHGEVCCSAVTLAAVCSDPERAQRAIRVVARDRGGQRVLVVPTDERLAVVVGAIMEATGAPIERIADAHVVAAAFGSSTSLVITDDPAGISALATALPGTRVLVREPTRLVVD
jgi:hypothetical protein